MNKEAEVLFDGWIRPQHSLLFVSSPGAECPILDRGLKLESNEQCVTFGIHAEVDGPTHLIVTKSLSENHVQGLTQRFSGRIDIFDGKLTVCGVYEAFVELEVPTPTLLIAVYDNASVSPDKVVIAINEKTSS